MPERTRLPRKLFIGVAMAAVLAPRVLPQAPSRQPKVDGELLVTHIERSVHLGVVPGRNHVPFGHTLEFYYGVKNRNDRVPGDAAIIVKVSKVYRQGTDEDWKYANKVVLFRNKFKSPKRVKKFSGEIDRARYSKYHQGLFFTSNRLERDFHVFYRNQERTDSPLNRRRAFLYQRVGPRNSVVAQKSYIVSYKGVQPEGSWIHFNIGLQMDFSEVYITITDLGISFIAVPVEKTWHLEAKR